MVIVNDRTILPPFFSARLASFCFCFCFFWQYFLFYMLDLLVFISFSFVFYLFIYFVLLLSYVLDLFLSCNIFLCVLGMYTGSFVLLFFYLFISYFFGFNWMRYFINIFCSFFFFFFSEHGFSFSINLGNCLFVGCLPPFFVSIGHHFLISAYE